MLICPNCRKKLKRDKNVYVCKNNHSFDISKYGYVNLLLPNSTASSDSGDSKDMIKSRTDFLNKGFYQKLSNFITNKINDLINDESIILDCGCGEGYFTTNIKNNMVKSTIYGLDVSKNAIMQAAKNKLDINYIVASGTHIPLADNSINLILNIFAPHFNEEFRRVLKPEGLLIKVIPGAMHLWELKETIYSNPYINEDKSIKLETFTEISKDVLEYKIDVDNQDLDNLLKMTPYYFKTSKKDKDKINNIINLKITVSFIILTYKKIEPNH